MAHMRFVSLLLAAALAAATHAQTTIVRYVDARATGLNNGQSWANAFTTLDAALNSSVATTPIDLRVAGTTFNGPHTAFRPAAAAGPLRILGGHRGLGAGGSPDDRDFEAFPTVIDGQGAARGLRIHTPNLGNPSFGPAVVVEGITFRNGRALGAGVDGFGGAIYLSSFGSVSIVSCRFEDNHAQQGGAIHWENAGAPDPAPSIRDCAFTGNVAVLKAGAGAISVNGLRVEDCAFDLNHSDGDAGALSLGRTVAVTRCALRENSAGVDGGAVLLENTSPTLRDSLFLGNLAGDDGGAVHLRVGATTPALIAGCAFVDNVAASRGGGVFVSGIDLGANSPSVRARLDLCQFFGNHAADGGGLYDLNALLDMASCVFSGNTASLRGGGYSTNRRNLLTNISHNNDGRRRVVNCTFSFNSAPLGGAVFRDTGNSSNSLGQDDYFLQLLNTVFNQNGCTGAAPCGADVLHSRGGSVSSGDAQILVHTSASSGPAGAFTTPTGSIFIHSSTLLGVSPSLLLTRPRGLDDVPGTLDDDLTLRANSPCVDQGRNEWLALLADLPDMDGDNDAAEPPPLDASRRARRQDTPAPDPFGSTAPVVDMGAYEAPFCQPCPGESVWQFALSGGFTDVARWIGGAPDTARDVRFDRPGAYSVSFAANAQNRSAAVRAGAVRFELNGRTWNLTAGTTTPFVVGAAAGDDAQAVIAGGRLLSGAGTIGRDAGSLGSVALDMPGSRWEVAQSLSVGLNGRGALRVAEDASVFSLLGGVGEQPGAWGHVVIEGPGAEWDVLFTLSISRGLVEVRNGGVLDVGLAAVVFPGGALAGDGVVAADLINFGLVRPEPSDPLGFTPAALTALGDYEQLGELPQVGDESGVLAVSIGAHHATGAVGATRLSVQGSATLAGGLIVSSAPGFSPSGAALTPMTLLEAPTMTGRFDAALLPGLNDGRFFFIEYRQGPGGGSVVLDTMPLAPGFGFEPGVGAVENGEPAAIVSADFNGDGAEDVALALPTSNAVVVLFSAGSDGVDWLGFASPSVLIPVGQTPRGVAAGDFNGDGLIDLAVCLADDNAVQVILNSGGGAFQTPGVMETFAVGFDPRALAAADLNGDQLDDLVVACFASDSVVFLLQQPPPMPGLVSMDRALDFAVGDGPRAVTLADFENDGFPDVVTSNFNDDTITLVRNQGEIRVGLVAFDVPVHEDPDSAAPGDLDEDKDVDLAIAARGGEGAVVVLRNLGNFTFAPPVPLPVGADPRSLAMVDLDLDGDSDLVVVVASDDGEAVVRVLRNDLNDGQIAFAPAEDLAGLNPLLVVAADVDADHIADLVVIREAPAPDPLRAPGGFEADGRVNLYCREDLNADGSVDFADLNLIFSSFNTFAGDPGFIPAADYNRDGVVNFSDLNAVLALFNTTCAQ